MVKRLEQMPSMHIKALRSGFEKSTPQLEPIQRDNQSDLIAEIRRLNETLTKLEERVNHIYIPKDGDTPFDVSEMVSGLNDPGPAGFPLAVGSQRTVYRFTPPVGQRLIIQSYEFVSTRDSHIIPGGMDFYWFNAFFSNQLRINNQNCVYSEYILYNPAADWPVGVGVRADRFAFNSISPSIDSQRNICNNIIVPGGSSFDWVITREQLNSAPPAPMPEYMFARFRGYLSTDFGGRKDRK